MSPEIPEAWRVLFQRCGLESMRGLAHAMGSSPQTALRVVKGQGVSVGTLQKAADALRVDVRHLHLLREEAVYEPFLLPVGTERLTAKQRAAVRAVITAMLEPATGAADGSAARRPRVIPSKRQAPHETVGDDQPLAARGGTPDLDKPRAAQDQAAEESQVRPGDDDHPA